MCINLGLSRPFTERKGLVTLSQYTSLFQTTANPQKFAIGSLYSLITGYNHSDQHLLATCTITLKLQHSFLPLHKGHSVDLQLVLTRLCTCYIHSANHAHQLFIAHSFGTEKCNGCHQTLPLCEGVAKPDYDYSIACAHTHGVK